MEGLANYLLKSAGAIGSANREHAVNFKSQILSNIANSAPQGIPGATAFVRSTNRALEGVKALTRYGASKLFGR